MNLHDIGTMLFDKSRGCWFSIDGDFSSGPYLRKRIREEREEKERERKGKGKERQQTRASSKGEGVKEGTFSTS